MENHGLALKGFTNSDANHFARTSLAKAHCMAMHKFKVAERAQNRENQEYGEQWMSTTICTVCFLEPCLAHSKHGIIINHCC